MSDDRNMAWPTVSNVELALIAMGFVTVEVDDQGVQTTVCSIGSSILRSTIITEAIKQIEAACGCVPILAEEPTDVKFDPPPNSGRTVIFRKPCAEVVSVTSNGTLLVADQDYFVYENAVGLVTHIELLAVPYQGRKSITINGYWGRLKEVPDDLQGACLRLACANAIIEFREGLKANPVRWQEGDVGESYGELMLKDAGETLRQQAIDSVVGLYSNPGAWF